MRWYIPALVGILFTAITSQHGLGQLKRFDNPSFDSQDEPLENQAMASTVRITAAGAEGVEIMELRIDDNVVRTWTVGGDANNGQFEEFVYSSSNTITADQVRIYFTNDLWDPAQGIDRNLRVDAITIDGTRFETEDPSVYSTGTWLPDDGIQPGFRESEWLHTEGYFQYASNDDNGTLIEVLARGNEGVEQFNLRIDDNVVGSYTTTTADQLFTYTATDTVTAAQIRIEFTNDFWDPDNGIDNNLFVDWIRVDGQTFQTEDPSVFSTGTWLPEDGIQPGFRESEWLHANGYFQYAASANIGGELRLVSSVYSVSESAGLVNVEILRENGAVGAVSIEYDTLDITATAGQDYTAVSGTVFWADGESGVRVVSIPIADDDIIESDEQFSFTIDNPTGDAVLLAPRTATITIDDNDSVTGQGDGLLGQYFNNIDLTNSVLVRTDPTIDFDWGNGAPAGGMGANTFSVRWTGQIEPRYSEIYTIRTFSDDGIRVWINGALIIDEWIGHPPTFHTATIPLESGVLADIRIEYYDNTGGAVARLEWSSASQALEVVPQSQLYAASEPDPGPGEDLVAQTLFASDLFAPTAIDWTPDGEIMYIAQKFGVVKTARNGTLESAPFIDISDIVNSVRDRGLLDIAVHPDFVNNPYVYLLFTYDPPEVNNYTGLAGPDGKGNRAGRLIRVTADASDNYQTAVPGSEVVILGTNSTWDNFNGFVNSTDDFDEPPGGINPDGTNIRDFVASDSESHTIGGLAFGIDGNLFVSIGDGTSYNTVDPRTVRVQDIDNLSGKVLRIDPINGEGISDNPFYNSYPNANRSKVYQYGLRNPFRITVDPLTGQLYIGDVGWTQWEEVNSAEPGANFGWPYYEGGSGVNLQTNGYQDLPEAQAFYASGQTATPAIYALNHSQSGINAIILGDFYVGTAYPLEYIGDLFFNDLGQGIVRNISFDGSNNINGVQTFTTGAQIVVDIKQGPDGNLYYVNLNDSLIGRWEFE